MDNDESPTPEELADTRPPAPLSDSKRAIYEARIAQLEAEVETLKSENAALKNESPTTEQEDSNQAEADSFIANWIPNMIT